MNSGAGCIVHLDHGSWEKTRWETTRWETTRWETSTEALGDDQMGAGCMIGRTMSVPWTAPSMSVLPIMIHVAPTRSTPALLAVCLLPVAYPNWMQHEVFAKRKAVEKGRQLRLSYLCEKKIKPVEKGRQLRLSNSIIRQLQHKHAEK